MKKTIFLTAIFALIFAMSASAQMSYGLGAVLGTKSAINSSGDETLGFGVNARANYAMDKFDVSGGFTYFIPSKVSDNGMDLSLNVYQINADLHYYLSKSESTSFYGLAGLNMSFATAKASVMGIEASVSDNKIGADLGVGIKMKKLFGEAKYDTALEQIALTVGVNF